MIIINNKKEEELKVFNNHLKNLLDHQILHFQVNNPLLDNLIPILCNKLKIMVIEKFNQKITVLKIILQKITLIKIILDNLMLIQVKNLLLVN